jgi:Ca-activated chloride channel family protein
MHPDDTFQVIDFGSHASQLFERPQPASAAMKARARHYIEALQANGGTMMAEAVRAAAAQPAAGQRLRVVTFMTDGYVGNDLEVISLVRELRGTSRWFAFGTGNAVNRFLLEEMARAGGGEVEYVLLQDSGEAVARRFWERISSPVLTDLRLEFEGLDVEDVLPLEPSDVWAERPLVVHARYRGPGRGRVIASGFRGGEPYREAIELALPAREPRHAALASLWARARVDELLRRDLAALQSGRFPAELRAQVEEVALAQRLVTPFTSFVAIDERVVNREGRLESVTVPVEMPQGVTHEGVFGEGAGDRVAFAGARPAPRAASARAESSGSAFEPAQGAPQPPPLPRPQPLPPAARERLAPELLALLEGGPVSPQLERREGRVRVRVVLAAPSAAAVRRLEALGLDVRQRAAVWLVGWIALERLAELAGAEGVRALELP